MIRIAVLMACHNRKEKTLNCLRELFKQQGLEQAYNLQVYLLDDGSKDGTEQAVADAFPKVKIINGNGNLYWNRGMYTAWESASAGKYDFYLWLNDDTNLYDYALIEMIAAAKETHYKAIICGCTESPFKKGELSYGGGKRKGKSYISNYPNESISQCDIINGNCVLIPKFVFENVGNLDWRFSHGIGDNDYSLRAKKQGILSYTTGHFIGSCARNESLPKWCLPHIKIGERISNLYSPLGNPPHQFFIFERRHFGLITALKHYLSIHLRILMPRLWK